MAAEETQITDVLIIGGGISGLAAALTLARQQHTVIVFDSSVYRNAPSPHMHNVLTWDRQSPADFRAAAKKNILDYYTTIQFQDVEVTSIIKNDPNETFTATDKTGKTWLGRKVILAQGVRDIFPDIEGYTDCWAKGVFHCFFCKGYEARGGESAGILALPDLHTAPTALHFARIALRFSKKITIYTCGSPELAKLISDTQGDNQVFKVDDRRIVRFEKSEHKADVILHFEDGEQVTESFIGHKPKTEPKGDLVKQLGLKMTAMNDPETAPMFYQSSIKGIFIGGDGASPIKIIPQSLFSGSAAAAAACAQLQAEDVKQQCIF